MRFILLIGILLTTVTSYGLSVSHLEGTSYGDYDKPTHIFVIGYGGGLADLFFKTAVGRARKYQQLFPDRQYVFIGPDKIDKSSRYFDDYDEYKATLKKLGLKKIRLDEKWLLSQRLNKILEKYDNIKSIEFATHSAAHYGMGLDDVPENDAKYEYKRYHKDTKGLWWLRNNLADDSYVMLLGCNSGFIQAPAMARTLGVPVFGSLTYTNFLQIYSDNNWYINDKGKYPAGLRKAKYNNQSFFDKKNCRSGNCTRMKPEPFPYAGYWGRLTAGISHYKAFCGSKNPDNTCKKVMALSLLGFPGTVNITPESTTNEFQDLAMDFLCPNSNRSGARKNCKSTLKASLTNADLFFSGMKRGTTIHCNFSSCDVEIQCGSEAGSCQTVTSRSNPKPKTMVNEFKAYTEGFELLKNDLGL